METNIDSKTQGAWLIHHASKLQTVVNSLSFENISIAGKAGMLLSALSTSKQLTINFDKVNTQLSGLIITHKLSFS